MSQVRTNFLSEQRLHLSRRIEQSLKSLATANDPQRLPLSAAIICLNEQEWIGTCIESLKCCSEIIIVDSGSTDNTLAIVKGYLGLGYPIRLLHQNWLGYAAQKQFACDQSSQQWVLSIDADEYLDADLQAELPKLLLADADIVGWKLRRTRKFYGPDRGLTRFARPSKIFRLYRNGHARFNIDKLVHEGLVANGRVKICWNGRLRHEGAFPAEKQIGKETRYAYLKARQRMLEGKRPSVLRLMLSPVYRFLRSMLMDRLILCGRQGLIEAQVSATYSLMTEVIHYQMWMESRSKTGDIKL